MSLKLATSGDFYTQAFNFVSATQSGVDPRTGLYTLKCAIADLSPNDGLGPQLKLALNYSPLSTSTVGLGTGCTLGLSSYDTDHSLLTLASGEQYKIIESSSKVVVKQKKIDNFRFEKFPDHYKITHKSGQTEILTGPDVAWHIKVPVQIFAPGGHAVTLNWTYVGGQPRLLNIQDEQATVLVGVDYSAGTGQTTLTVWTGATESRRIVLHFMNDRLNSLDQVAGNTTLTWQFKNEAVGDYTLITGLTSPSGLIEQVSYRKDGHAFPSSAGMKPLPYVTQLTQYPQRNQPKITLNYRYTTTNYLGGGNGQSWSNSEDYLYGVLSSYLYGSTEARQDGDVLIETTRTYNNYHLLTEEKVAQDGCVRTRTTDYYAVVGKVFDDQPNQFQFPSKVTVQYTSASGDTSEPEVTHTEFDDSGNTTKKVEPDGMTTTWDYYPADGEGDNCPAEPNGFVRCVRTETVTPGTPVPASATYTAPVHRKQYTFEKLPAANIAGTPVPYVLSTATEKYLSDDVVNCTKQMSYINAPDSADHGRLSSQSVTLYTAAPVPQATQSFTRQHAFTYERADGVLATTTTITGHDNIATTSVSGRQRLTGLLAFTTDVLGNTTDYTYDGLGRMQSKTLSAKSAYEHTTTYGYTVDENGSTVTTTDPSGNQIRTGYDALERMVQKEQWNNDDLRLQGAPFVTESHQYDALGRKSQITLTDQLSAGVGDATTVVNGLLGYDSWGNPSKKTFNDGREENSHYDPVTRTLTNTASGEGNGNAVTLGSQVTTYSLSALPVSSTRYRADNTQESQNTQEYDGLRRLRKVTDAMGYVTLYEYDWCGRAVQTTLPDNTVIRKTYAPHSTRPLVSGLTVTDAQGVLIDMGSQTFDSLNRRTGTTSGGRVWQFTYNDACDKPAQTTTPNGAPLKYTYIPELGNALQTVDAPDIQKTFEYDKTTGQARTAQEANGRKNAWSYYPSGRLESETIDDDLSTHYSYSLLGLQQSYTDVMQGEQTTQYDGKGRRTGVTTPGISATLKYDDIGRMESYTATDIASKATLTTTLTFDDFSREIRRDITDQKGQSVFSVVQTYYPNGQVKNRTTTRGDESLRDEKYTYNNRNQLIDYTCSGSAKPLDAYGKAITHQAFTYGVLGNITTMVTEFEGGKDTASYTYAANDPTQLSSVTHTHKDYPALQTLTYDNAGQLTDDGVGHTLSYDALGRVINIQGTKSQGCTYRYDASNTQVGQDISGGSQHDFYYAAGARVNEIVKGKDEQQRRWLKLGATCLGQQTEGTGAQTLLTGTDAMNSVLAADGPDGTQNFSYSPYGVRTAPEDATVPVGFNGEAFDPIISGYFLGNGARLYIPSLGIFNKPDDLSPFGAGGINPYAYCLGDPINRADPTGHISIGGIFGLIFGAIGAVIAAVVTFGAAIPMITAGAVTLAGGLAVAGGITGGVAAGLGIASQLVTNKKVASALGWASLGLGLASLATGIGAAVAASRAAAAAAEGAEEAVGEAMELTEMSPVEEETASLSSRTSSVASETSTQGVSAETQAAWDALPPENRAMLEGLSIKYGLRGVAGERQLTGAVGSETTQAINDAQASASESGLVRQASLRSISSTNSEELRSTFEALLDKTVNKLGYENKPWQNMGKHLTRVSVEYDKATSAGFTRSTAERLNKLLLELPHYGGKGPQGPMIYSDK